MGSQASDDYVTGKAEALRKHLLMCTQIDVRLFISFRIMDF